LCFLSLTWPNQTTAQFREEKDHKLQVRAFARLLQSPTIARHAWADSVRLLLVGGCRGPADQQVRRRASTLDHLFPSKPQMAAWFTHMPAVVVGCNSCWTRWRPWPWRRAW
jgi:hypothetical protein